MLRKRTFFLTAYASLMVKVWVFALFGQTAAYLSAEQPKSPNVLLITVDTLRADRVSLYDTSHVRTPHIDSIADRGTVFLRSFAHSPMTLPSHASILLGLHPASHGIHENATFIVPDKALTLAEYMKALGYSTGAFIGSYSLDARFGLNQGFDVYDDDYGHQDFENPYYTERRADVVVDRALAWLRAQSDAWFLWVHLFDPHAEYNPPEPFQSQYKGSPYEGEIAYSDQNLGRLLAFLKTSDTLQNTLVIFTSDHGESLGEHGEKTHGFAAYNSTLWIPLIIAGPGLEPLRSTQNVGHFDIFPTICELLKRPPPEDLDGLSLVPAMHGNKIRVRPIYFESLYPYYSLGWAPMTGLIQGKRKFIESPIPELYDLEADFAETTNKAESSRLRSWRKRLGLVREPLSSGNDLVAQQRVDPLSRAKMESLGYFSGRSPAVRTSFEPRDDIKILLPFYNRIEEAVLAAGSGKLPQAVEMLKEVITERSDLGLAYSQLARLYKVMGRPGAGLEVLKLGLDRLPESYEIFLAYISSLLSTGRSQEVIAAFETYHFRKMEYDPEIWNSLGVAYFREGVLSKALEAYKKALVIDEHFPAGFNNLGSTYLASYLRTASALDMDNALRAFNRALEIDPRFASAHNNLGAAYSAAGRINNALDHWKKSVEIDPNSRDAVYNLGLTLFKQGKMKEASVYLLRYKREFSGGLRAEEKAALDDMLASADEKTK